jgi:hypothetical protein
MRQAVVYCWVAMETIRHDNDRCGRPRTRQWRERSGQQRCGVTAPTTTDTDRRRTMANMYVIRPAQAPRCQAELNASASLAQHPHGTAGYRPMGAMRAPYGYTAMPAAQAAYSYNYLPGRGIPPPPEPQPQPQPQQTTMSQPQNAAYPGNPRPPAPAAAYQVRASQCLRQDKGEDPYSISPS